VTAAAERLRLRYAKLGKVRFTSQRDVARMWERALRRSALPVAWSAGFSPHPLLSFGLALPTGCESDAEYLDVALADEVLGSGPAAEGGGPEAAELVVRLSELLPEGVDVHAGAPIGGGVGSLQQEVTSCSWELEVTGVTAADLATRVERLLDAGSVPIRRERKGRQVDDDLRPSVLALAPLMERGGPAPTQVQVSALRAELSTQPRGVRPMELLAGLGTGVTLVKARRTHQWIERDGVRREPLPVAGGAAATDRAPERAS